jgi:hypothetical protein
MADLKDPNRTNPPANNPGVPQPPNVAGQPNPAAGAAQPRQAGDLAGIFAAAMALAQDLRARNWPAVLSGAINLLQLIMSSAGGPVVMATAAGPGQPQQQGALMSVGEVASAAQARSASVIADEIEQLCKPHANMRGAPPAGFTFDWKKLAALALQALMAFLSQTA